MKVYFVPIAAFLLVVTDIVAPWQTLLLSTFGFRAGSLENPSAGLGIASNRRGLRS